MTRLRIATVEGNYKETDRQLKEQFINRLNDDDMMIEIIKELTINEENENITSGQIVA